MQGLGSMIKEEWEWQEGDLGYSEPNGFTLQKRVEITNEMSFWIFRCFLNMMACLS